MNKKEDSLAFAYQEIPLEQIKNAILAGDGHYADVKAALLEKLPNLQPDNTFAFGLPNKKEVPEESQHAICIALNQMLAKTDLLWKVKYAKSLKLFVCIPRMTRGSNKNTKKVSARVTQSQAKQDYEQVVELYRKGLSAKKMHEEHGIRFGTAKRHITTFRKMTGEIK